MPSRRIEGKPYINKFKKYFTQNDLKEVINTNSYLVYRIFENHGVNIDYGEEGKIQIEKIISKFYA